MDKKCSGLWSMSGWKSVTSGARRSVLGPVLFTTFTGVTQGSTLNKFSDNTKLSSAVDTPEEWNAIQRDLEKYGEWALWEIYEVQQGQVQCSAPESEQPLLLI